MACARKFHTSTLLIDGSVLVVGGSDRLGDLSSVERYDPVADQWRIVSAMNTARCHHSATRLANGCVLVTGGFNGVALSSAELFDPAQNQWHTSSAMHTAQGHGLHSATLLQDGRVLVASSSGAELYDPESNAWQGVAYSGRDYQTATLLTDGQVLLAGGAGPWDELGMSAGVVRFDPATALWQPAAHLPQSRVRHTATRLNNGQVLLAGGDDGRSLYVTDALCFDPTTQRWSPAGTLTTAREHGTSSLLLDGSVLLVGGDGPAGVLASVERFDSKSLCWQTVAPMLADRWPLIGGRWRRAKRGVGECGDF
jgi:large repetitive protein